jgi:hypothetical protein
MDMTLRAKFGSFAIRSIPCRREHASLRSDAPMVPPAQLTRDQARSFGPLRLAQALQAMLHQGEVKLGQFDDLEQIAADKYFQ